MRAVARAVYPFPIGARALTTFRNPRLASAVLAGALASAQLGVGVSSGATTQQARAHARTAASPTCRGRARRVRPGKVSISFACGGEDVTGFTVQANRTLHYLYDPSYAFGCERTGSRSYSCSDIHSGAGSQGSALATVSEPLCKRGAHLYLRITPALNFEEPSLPSFTLKGPC